VEVMSRAERWDGIIGEAVNESQLEQLASQRRDLSLSCKRVDMCMYRHTRTSSDVVRRPPHFVYHLRCDWSGTPTRPVSPRSPGSRSMLQSPRTTANIVPNDNLEPWWDLLPPSYVIRRRWPDIVRFHEALESDLAFDARLNCKRVKALVPKLPDKGNLDKWLHHYAATGDACALSRAMPLSPPSAIASLDFSPKFAPTEDLDGLHWIYVELRLAPYFAEVNRILHELPTEVLAGSAALRRFVLPGSAALRHSPLSPVGVANRFLGPTPMADEKEDLAKAALMLRRSRSTSSMPSLRRSGSGAQADKKTDICPSSPSAAAAKLMLSR